MTTPAAAHLLDLGVCCRGHSVYAYEDVTPDGACVRCVAELAAERAAVYAHGRGPWSRAGADRRSRPGKSKGYPRGRV